MWPKSLIFPNTQAVQLLLSIKDSTLPKQTIHSETDILFNTPFYADTMFTVEFHLLETIYIIILFWVWFSFHLGPIHLASCPDMVPYGSLPWRNPLLHSPEAPFHASRDPFRPLDNFPPCIVPNLQLYGHLKYSRGLSIGFYILVILEFLMLLPQLRGCLFWKHVTEPLFYYTYYFFVIPLIFSFIRFICMRRSLVASFEKKEENKIEENNRKEIRFEVLPSYQYCIGWFLP